MNRLKRIAAWSLLIVLCFSIFPCKVTYAADNGFTIEDNSGNTYSAVATDLVNSVDYTDTNTKIYCVWVPDSVTSLTVKSKKYTNAACHCDNNKITCESNNGELTATVLTETEHDSWCLKESLESGDVAGAESYIDWNSATSLFTVHLMTGEDLDNLGENVMIFVQVGGTKPGSDVTPPELALATDGVERTSDTTATIKFTSNEAGIYYYSLASADVDTSVAGTTMVSGENTLNITGLTAGEVTVYIKAQDVVGNVTESALEITIPTYVPTYKIQLTLITPAMYRQGYRYVSAAAGGFPLKSNEDAYLRIYEGAQAGQTVKVTLLIPEADKELESVSLITDDGNNTPIDVTVDGTENSFTFTMPAVNVSSNSFTLKDSVVVRYNLKADVSLLHEDLADSDGNRQGTVTFTDADGVTLMQAQPHQQVTVTANPKPYTAGNMFQREFVRWKDIKGIEVSAKDQLKPSFTFEMPENDVYLFAEFKNVGTEITWGTKIDNVIGNVTSVSLSGLGSERSPFTFAEGAELDAVPLGTDWWYRYEFTGWTVTRDREILTDVDTSQLVSEDRPEGAFGYATWASFSVSGEEMTVTANFHERAFAAVTAKADPTTMGSAAVSVGSSDPVESKSVVFEGQTVTLTATPKSERYKLDETNPWTVTDSSGAAIAVTPVTPETPETQADTGTTGDTGDTGDTGTTETPETPEVTKDYSQVTFTMPSTGKDITATANFVVDTSKPNDDCSLLRVELWSADGKNRLASSNKSGDTYTIELPASVAVSDLPNLRLKFICGDAANAVVKQGNTEWSKDGQACGITTLGQTQVFTVVAEDGQTSAPYKVVINAETKITAVTLLNGTETIASGKLSGSKWTITLPDSIDADLLAKIGASDTIFMKIEYAGKSLKQVATTNGTGYDDAGQKDSWASGKIMCAISPGSEAQFIVTGIDGLTKEYTIAITRPNVSTTPVLEKVSVERTSDNAATVKFTSSMAGNYFYKVVAKGAAAPTVNTTRGGTTAVKGENTITLTNLSTGARDIYIVVKSLSNVECDPFKIEIPAYGSTETPDEGDFTIRVDAPPTGGTIATNRTRANEGDEIIVTVTPKTGYQMKAGSLRYAFSEPGAAYTAITGYSFKMPGGDVSITCDWETASTTVNGITAFSINGVAGAVNNSTNTITITMPRGTDVTKLTPVIATNGVKSLTPGNGETVNFTNAVTYTVAMEDGSSKTYTVTVYVDKGTLADQFWDKLTDFATQVPWWQYAEKQQSTSKYPKYW